MPKTFRFYGVCGTAYKLDDRVWEAKEDESDGYRSYLQSILLTDDKNLVFFDQPLALVQVIKVNDPDGLQGWHLVDVKDEWVWLKVGTNYHDDCYPYFVFEYLPKPKPPAWEEFIGQEE